VPNSLPAADLSHVLRFLDVTRAEGLARKKEWRPQLADRESVGRDRASAFWAAQRLRLEPADRRALLELLGKGSRGTSSPPPANVTFMEGAGP
jgi:hypothetical protein